MADLPEKPKKSTIAKILKILGFTIGGIVLLAAALVGAFFLIGVNYKDSALRKVEDSGFTEKTFRTADGTLLHYAEGPDNGPALLLIHGQMVYWESYLPVLPELSEHFRVFALDCHGHGESSRNPEKYNVESMGLDFKEFMNGVIGEPAVVSGNSSGGLLALWLAANAPETVRGIVLEDPPLFSSEYPRIKATAAWEGFEIIPGFLESGSSDFLGYFLMNSRGMRRIGGAANGVYSWIQYYRRVRPGAPVEVFFMPRSIRMFFKGMTMYDPRFGLAFYDGSWHRNFDHAETLARVGCPTVLIHANWFYSDDGILMGAMDGDDAAKGASLVPGCELVKVDSGHCVHAENPKAFTKIVIDFGNRISRE